MSTYERVDELGGLHTVAPYSNTKVISASETLTASQSGTAFLIATDALTITLPSSATVGSGVVYTFINSGADGNNIITISPNASDGIFGSITLAASVFSASGTDDKDLINTKATANKGDLVSLVSDGVAGWYIVYGVGIWASEA